MSASKKVLVPIGTGSEEMEAVITIDVLRRAGAEVTVASVEPSLEVLCSRNVKIVADKVREKNNGLASRHEISTRYLFFGDFLGHVVHYY